ncbi:TetR/AcrR family transcriptional regulator [Cryptosporangium minutisporangium]|uniref:TetR/AcrR family transcriptional regulator n=1 Tax=Cryptosporangium minutisporangium TaxID=113569 RepID=A0ABP6T109_9ACTN
MSDSVNSRPDGRSARWSAHRARRRAELVDAAVAAIEQHGPEVTAGQIAAAAGVARPHLYRHFDDAADLRHAVVDRALALYQAGLAPVWRPQGTPRQMVRAAVDAHLDWLSTHPQLHRYALRAARDVASDHRAHIGVTDVADPVDAARSGIAAHVGALVQDVVRAQSLEVEIAEPLAYGLVSMVDAAATRWMDRPAGLIREEFADQLTDWVWSVFETAFRASGLRIEPDRPLTLGTPPTGP